MLQIDTARIHQQVEAWGRTYGPLFRFRLGRSALLGRRRPRGDGRRAARPARRLPAHASGSRRSRAEMGLTPGVFGAKGEAWRRQRRMVMAGFDPRHLRAYFPSLVKVARGSQRAGARAARRRHADRPAGRPDALHGRRDPGPGLRRRRQHARVRRRGHPAPPRQDLPGAVPAPVRAAAAVALVQERRRSRARPQRRRGQRGDRRLHRRGARAPGRPIRRGARAPPTCSRR